MSQFRFLVTGEWRLGSPLEGLTGSPGWLRRAAASAVRQSVQQVLDAAVANRVCFILVCGRIASRDNFSVAAAWLRERAAGLCRQGIQLVLAGHDEQELGELRGLNVVRLPGALGNWITTSSAGIEISSRETAGALRFDMGVAAEFVSQPSTGSASAGCGSAVSGPDRGGVELSITAGRSRTAADGRGIPGRVSGSNASVLRMYAGSPQRLSIAEAEAGQCALVTADTESGEIFCEQQLTEVIEFLRVEETCESGTTLPGLLGRLVSTSRGQSSCSPVQLVEYRIGGRLRLSLRDDSALREADLLQLLRVRLNSGHSGVWPYRLRFAEDFQVDLCAGNSRLLAESCGVRRLGPESELPELLHQLQRVA